MNKRTKKPAKLKGLNTLKYDVRCAVRALYGARCKMRSAHCPCCRAWVATDVITGDKPKWPRDPVDRAKVNRRRKP